MKDSSGEEVLLGDVAVMTSGGTPPSGVAHFYGGGIPWVSISDITRSGKYVTKTEKTLSAAGLINSAAQLYADGIVLYAMYASLGECAIAVGQVSSSQAILGINPGPRLHRDYLYYYLSSIKSSVRELGQHGAQANLNAGMVRRFTLRLPSLREQRAIAEVLTDADDLISTLERLIKKKEDIKQGMMQELLTGWTRLPGFTEPWQVHQLENLLSYEQPSRYLVQTDQQLEAGQVPVLTAGKTFVLGYTNETHGVYTAHPVIIFDDFTTASKFVDFDFKAKSSAMKILSARPDVDLRFTYERMQLINFPLGDHKRYWISEYSKQVVTVPTQVEQVAIGRVVTDVDKEIVLIKARLDKARAIKQGMMQQLLTGRIRLPVAEVVA